eukprot:Gregarina_sp_Pseudo_9__2600@NODE_2861_length_848_cov_4_195303_g2618_i0_p1_GENE_NODE_2861_length_848_cov_4_195303_g2618_i0NODE_2861_length_848_cov_4_195303_g2618_i0_p1_ORF_typecomplete_len245_score20_44Arf/PF00025_21/1_8e51Ras/PF00071_22/1_6e13Roc/PF08477_13/1_4e10Gtr1_RagA/PF04670_12/2_7e10SRPRB/PF09439_10/8_5e10Galpha/PF00503_20/11Galpha/PF00503_20/6_9e07MMR_HSR1/PF01926_23/4_7e06FeoB_N/PF02421_18/0_00034GTP_EFTU/PF00009_27/0_004MnmE_helical/PF12631_7/0_014RsgA_GTPase/PF03193_16/0_92RsgA_GTPase
MDIHGNSGARKKMVLLREIKAEQTRNHSIRCLVLGLDNAGKSSVVAKLFNQDSRAVAPTVGFQISTMRIHRVSVDFWDVGGQKTLRPFWSNYFHAADALIWVIDSTDRARMDICRSEFENVLGEERLEGSEVLVLANKQDVAGAANVDQVREILDFSRMEHDRKCMIARCSAVSDSPTFFQELIIEKFLNQTRKRLHAQTPDFRLGASIVEELPSAQAIDWNGNVPFQDEETGFIFDTRARLFA